MAPTQISIFTGFLGSGKTTLILNLLEQLPPTYKLALLKNEFGDVAVDSQLAASASISGVQELLNGCICCNLVGQLGDALESLRSQYRPDRIVIETSGSAFPATLAMEVNRLIKDGGDFALDGVVSVVDVENWRGYDDTSVTARLQARYTDLVVFNKWEGVPERRFDECLDRLGDLEVQTPWVKSDRGRVDGGVLLGLDSHLARSLAADPDSHDHGHGHGHDHGSDHQSEVEVLSVTVEAMDGDKASIDSGALKQLLETAPKDEIYRIKAILYTDTPPEQSSDADISPRESFKVDEPKRYILNWAFGRWTCTRVDDPREAHDSEGAAASAPALRMTIVLARYESTKWKTRLEQGGFFALEGVAGESTKISINRVS